MLVGAGHTILNWAFFAPHEMKMSPMLMSIEQIEQHAAFLLFCAKEGKPPHHLDMESIPGENRSLIVIFTEAGRRKNINQTYP